MHSLNNIFNLLMYIKIFKKTSYFLLIITFSSFSFMFANHEIKQLDLLLLLLDIKLKSSF